MAATGGFSVIIIGDEIIRGKRPDKHFAKTLELLSARGLTLDVVTYVGDNPTRLTDVLRHSLSTDDVVFSFGGIGITPDDRTRQCAADAAGLPLEVHSEAERVLRARFAEMKRDVTDELLQFGAFPQGSRVIPNPVNRIPGFSFHDHHFVPGFPQMAWPMIEWVLETYYRDRFHRKPEAEKSVFVWGGNEGTLLPLMKRLEQDYAGLLVFSLPSFGDDTTPSHVELGVRGDPKQVKSAFVDMCNEVLLLGFTYSADKKNPSHKTGA
ncbi:MAG: molybdopterin-binding protein [Georgfuchsia sp.]